MSEAKSPQPFRRVALALAALALVVPVGFFFYTEFLGTRDVDIAIVNKVEFNTWIRLRPRKQFRIETNLGSFRLPSVSEIGWYTSRDVLWRELKEGCRYRVRVNMYPLRLFSGDQGRISAIRERIGC